MGRGRAKAKQTKVARRLKYYSPDTDLTALERELANSGSESFPAASGGSEDADDDEDPYADPYDDEPWTPGR